jgi:AcrR family transcriptional regulator
LRHASLYYYAPRGKEQLYVEVTERSFQRHNAGVTEAIIGAGDDLRAQLHAAARWFASQSPIDLGRMVRSDMLALPAQEADRLMQACLAAIRTPIAAAIRNAARKGLLTVHDADFAAMGFVGLVQSVHNIPKVFLPTPEDLAQAACRAADMLLDGWRVR